MLKTVDSNVLGSNAAPVVSFTRSYSPDSDENELNFCFLTFVVLQHLFQENRV